MRSTVATQKAVLKTPGIGSASEFSTSTFGQEAFREIYTIDTKRVKNIDLHANDDVVPSIRHGGMRERRDRSSDE